MVKLPVEIIDVYFDTEIPRKGIFQPVSKEELIKGIKETLYGCANCFDNRHAFSFFKLVSESPKEAEECIVDALNKTSKGIWSKNDRELLKSVNKRKYNNINFYEKVQKICKPYGIKFDGVGDAIHTLGMIQKGWIGFLDSSQKAYKELVSNEENSSPYYAELKATSNALNSDNFKDGGHYYLEESIGIPDDTKLKDCDQLTTAGVVLYLMSKFDAKPRYFEEVRWTGHGMDKNHYKIAGFLMEGMEPIRGEEFKFLVTTEGNYSDNLANNQVKMIYKTSKDTPNDKFLKKVWGNSWHKVFVETPIKEAFGGKSQAGYDDINEVGEQLPYKFEHPEKPSISEIWGDRRDIGAAP